MLCIAVVLSSMLTVCCKHLLFLLITSLPPEALFTNAYSICWVLLSCTAGILKLSPSQGLADSCRRLCFTALSTTSAGPAGRGQRSLKPSSQMLLAAALHSKARQLLAGLLKFLLLSAFSPGDGTGGCTEVGLLSNLPWSMPTAACALPSIADLGSSVRCPKWVFGCSGHLPLVLAFQCDSLVWFCLVCCFGFMEATPVPAYVQLGKKGLEAIQ